MSDSNLSPGGTSGELPRPLAPDLAPGLWDALRVSSADFELAVGLAKILRAWPALPLHVRQAVTTLFTVTTARDSGPEE
jgi:hypothetical protein